MAEQKGFFRRIFSFGAPEDERVPEHGETPRTQDTTAQRDDATAAEIHQPAAASTDADTEAGADMNAPDEGGITPLTPRDEDAGSVSAQKKTLN